MDANLMVDARQIALWHANRPDLPAPSRRIKIKFRDIKINTRTGIRKDSPSTLYDPLSESPKANEATDVHDLLPIAEGDDPLEDRGSWLDCLKESDDVGKVSDDESDSGDEILDDDRRDTVRRARSEDDIFMAGLLVDLESRKLLAVLRKTAQDDEAEGSIQAQRPGS